MNKLIPYTLLGLIVLALSGCSKKPEDAVGIKNPISGVIAQTNTPIIKKEYQNPTRATSTATSNEMTSEEAEQAIINYFKEQMGEEEFNKSYRGKMFNKDPKVTLNIDDHDPETAEQLRKDLKFRDDKGYLPLDQKDMNDYHDTNKDLYSSGDASDSAAFELSKLPADLSQCYSGYTREGVEPNAPSNVRSPVIRRVFNYLGSTILLQEESAKNGSSHFTKEFVNEDINGYPGVFNTYRSKDNKELNELEWNTHKYRYSMECISNKPVSQQRQELRHLALEITRLNG